MSKLIKNAKGESIRGNLRLSEVGKYLPFQKKEKEWTDKDQAKLEDAYLATDAGCLRMK